MADYKDNLFYGSTGNSFELARLLRKGETKAEQVLWKVIRNRQILGAKFRRQHPISSFAADFYCHETILVLEVDGEVHDTEEAKEYDAKRTKELKRLGLKVIRFRNEDVFNEIDKVISTITNYIIEYRSKEG